MFTRTLACFACLAHFALASPAIVHADGKMVPPRNYAGSLEERAQEAIIIFHGSDSAGEASQDLILKVTVSGEADKFAWVIPFPAEPKVEKEDAALFRELFDYVQARSYRPKGKFDGVAKGEESKKPAGGVEVLSRQVVGSYDVTIVRETEAGALNQWLKKEGYQELENADDVIGFYRQKGYVFAAVKVNAEELVQKRSVDLHPLRFSFKTGGRDGIYFPMRMTGLQTAPFDVNLYVFYRFWLNDQLSKFGYVHRGFRLNYRDWDTAECDANGGKAWSAPTSDPFLREQAFRVQGLSKLFQKLHPGERYYLTNLQATGLKPTEVRQWSDDLWLFPYYTSPSFVPYDARKGGPAATAWPGAEEFAEAETHSSHDDPGLRWYVFAAGGGALVFAALLIIWLVLLRGRGPA